MSTQSHKEEAFRAQLHVKLHCPACGPEEAANIIEEYSSGDLVCGDCGLVLEDRIIDAASEWRTFANEDGDDPSRVGSAQDSISRGLQIQSSQTRISSKEDTEESRALRRTASRVSTSQGKALQEAFELIQTRAESISLDRNVVDTAKQIYSVILKEQLLKRKSQEAIVGATIYTACKSNRVSRTIHEIVAMSKVPRNQIVDCYDGIKKCSSIQALLGSGVGGEEGSHAATQLIARFSSHLGIKVKGFVPSAELLSSDVIRSGLLAGRSPVTIAAVVLLMNCNLWSGEAERETERIAAVASISETTIKNAYKILVSEQKQGNSFISEEFKEKNRDRIDLRRL